MKARDIISLVDGLAPIITASFDKAAAPLLERIKLLENHNAELGAQLRAIQVPAAAEIAKLVEVKEFDLVATVDLCTKQVLENIPAAPTVEEIAKLVPLPKDGKDADPELIKTQVKDAMALWGGEFKLALPEIICSHVDDAIEGAAVRDAIGAAAKAAVEVLPKPKDGKDVDKEELSVIVAEHVEDAMKNMPAPKDGKDATPEEIVAAVEKVLATWERPKDGESVKPEDVKAMVDEAVANIPRIVQDGKDATPEDIAAAVEKVLATWPKPKDGKSVDVEAVNKLINDTVASYVAEIPAPKNGNDGVGLAGVLKDHEGCVVFTLTDGTMAKIGRVDGEDGLGFDDLEMVETETHVTFRFMRGERVKEFSYTKATIADFYKGIWAPGTYKRGSLVTWGGSLWLALKETTTKPDTKDSDDWKLVVKRGRDGKDFTPVK